MDIRYKITAVRQREEIIAKSVEEMDLDISTCKVLKGRLVQRNPETGRLELTEKGKAFRKRYSSETIKEA